MSFLYTHILHLALTLAVAAFLTVVGVLGGAWSGTIVLILVPFFTVLTAGLAFLAARETGKAQQDALRACADEQRLRAALAVQSDAFCIFSSEGVFLEESEASVLLGLAVLAHFDDLVGAVRDSADLVGAFRQLQKSGRGFVLDTTASANERRLKIRGQRHGNASVGDAVYDILWLHDDTACQSQMIQMRDKIAAAETRTVGIRALFDSLAFPVWTRGADLRLSWCNKVYAAALDATPDEIIAKQIELVPAANRGGVRALALRAQSQKMPQNERRHVVIAGQRRLLSITEHPLGDGAVEAMLGYAPDVTVEEEKDAELQRHISAHHQVLDNIGTPIVVYGPDQRMEFYNRAYLSLWDADENFLDTKPTFGEILEDLRTRRRAPEQADFQRYKRERIALFTSLIEPREDMMHLPDGSTLRIVAMPHPFGGLMFMHEDVTDKLALESSYNTLIAVQRETLDNLAEGIAVFGSDGKLKLFNPSFARIWKMPEEDLLTEPHINDLMERIRPLFDQAAWANIRADMITYTLEREQKQGRLARADGGMIEFRTVPLPDGAVLNSFLDVTDSLKVEQALRATNAALANADRLKSEFVANVSYQLRTPLNTIMGFAEILTNQYFGTLNERQLEYTRTMMESSRRLKSLIDDVLDLATIEAGRMTLDRRAVAVTALLQAVSAMIGERARQQSIEIAMDLESNIGSFDIDERRMKQALFNLMSNAIQYTPPGGRVTLQARRKDDAITISVIDTGIGIPPVDQERVWGKFERANPQARQGGAGLGLSLVRSFVELHGGHVEIVSQINQGTRISCTLPVKSTEPHGPVA